jgi:uncharacterized protein YcbX
VFGESDRTAVLSGGRLVGAEGAAVVGPALDGVTAGGMFPRPTAADRAELTSMSPQTAPFREPLSVRELWRYPVKSLQGERLSEAEIGALGMAGDRRWALFDRDTGLGLTARRVPELLFGSARIGNGGLEVVLPDGTVTTDDRLLSDWLGRRVQLRAASEDGAVAPTYETPVDELVPDPTEWMQWEGAPGPFHDSPRIRLSLVSTGTLGAWDRRRFRANVVLDGEGEDHLRGQEAALGSARLRIGVPIPRCVMTTRPQPEGIGRDISVLTTIHRERAGLLAVRAAVLEPGTVRTGDMLVPDRAAD